MHADELLLQQALVAEVQYGRTGEELGQILSAAGMKCNIESIKLKDLFSIIAATAEVGR